MAGRCELSDQRWQMIEDIVSPPQTMGRPRRNDRQVLNGILWILCSGAQWHDLPKLMALEGRSINAFANGVMMASSIGYWLAYIYVCVKMGIWTSVHGWWI